jgi:hypothetical protein
MRVYTSDRPHPHHPHWSELKQPRLGVFSDTVGHSSKDEAPPSLALAHGAVVPVDLAGGSLLDRSRVEQTSEVALLLPLAPVGILTALLSLGGVQGVTSAQLGPPCGFKGGPPLMAPGLPAWPSLGIPMPPGP